MKTISFNVKNALDYAYTWALSRNPDYYDFSRSSLGGDCTNFISQCLHAGGGIMNYKKDYGWYYRSLNDRSPAWTGTEPLYRFLLGNKGVGPYGREIDIEDVQPGDIAQLLFPYMTFYSHSLIILKTGEKPSLENTLIACHTFDALLKPLSAYYFQAIRFIRVQGIRIN